MENKFVAMLQQSLKDAYETLEGTMQGVTSEVAHWQPPGKALPIGALYVHIITSEDMMLNGFVLKKPPLADEWKDKMGLSKPMPSFDKWDQYEAWTHEVKIDLEKFKEYTHAVREQSNKYISSLTDADLLEKQIDLSMWQMGNCPLGRFIMRYLIAHVDSVGGEISAEKGLQGLKGYPF